MTDGPFKNLKLGRCWKRFANAVQSEASSHTECVSLGSHALVRDLTTFQHRLVLENLQAHSRGQLDLDPITRIEEIFDAHPKTPFLDAFYKQLRYRVENGAALPEALPQALVVTIENQISEARNRFEEHLIHVRDTAKVSQETFQQALDKTNVTFNAIEPHNIYNALWAGDKNAFKDAARKKVGLEEGPRL